jgi:hypothetical protein
MKRAVFPERDDALKLSPVFPVHPQYKRFQETIGKKRLDSNSRDMGNRKSATMFFVAEDPYAASRLIEQAESCCLSERGGFSFIDPS